MEAPTESEVRACRKGFDSKDGKIVLESLQKLSSLLRRAGYALPSERVLDIHKKTKAAVGGDVEATRVIEEILKIPDAKDHCKEALDRLESEAKPRNIVLNVSNIGCRYGDFVEKADNRSYDRSNKFNWKGVQSAYDFYASRGFTVHAVIGERCLNRAGGPKSASSAELEKSLVIIPARDEMRDNDDFSTLQEAMKFDCQFVDNDNYRDWNVHRLKDWPKLQSWVSQNSDKHVAYYFDRMGAFTPMKDPLMGSKGQQLPPAKTTSATASRARRRGTPETQREIPERVEQTDRRRPLAEPAGDADIPTKRRRAGEISSDFQEESRRIWGGSSSSSSSSSTSTAAATAVSAGRNGEARVIHLQLPKASFDAPKGAESWLVLRQSKLFQAPNESSTLLKTLRPNDRIQKLMQRPAKGEPEWIAVNPRGWVRVEKNPPNLVCEAMTD
eukprot:TRINITY_DN93976_c0_g1_i1.p1 TRINITY_DN93976_c0_g1~~TRINITY_DN93976_c0_g1_i1.p1  ORF type:complete len:443 (+),score=82.42 TRINITY_DN93976_c0_g1_i1:59-1387(+)